jgi:hypothetical protein
MKSSKLFQLIIRVSKSDSAFIYFQLEANEGLCFYSTLDHEVGDSTRDIHIQGSMDFEAEIRRLLEYLNQSIPITFLEVPHD